MGELPTPIRTKIVVEPVIKWEQRGNEMLTQFFSDLDKSNRRLSTASDHYLHNYQGESTPGVSGSLEAHIKSADVYRNTADETIKHVVNSAANLTKQVENRLSVIQALTPTSSSSSRELSEATTRASSQLKQLFKTKNLNDFNIASQSLTRSLDQEISHLRTGATSGLQAAQEVAELSNTERETFGAWWRSNYKEGYFQTIPHYQQSLQAFAETASARNSMYHQETKSVLDEMQRGPLDSFNGFLNDFRKSRFPQVKK